MNSKMKHATRAELAAAIRARYAAAKGKQKRKILDEFIATTGYHEKSAIRVLNSRSAPKQRQLVSGPRSMMRPRGPP
jgi:hypothetical protein